MTSWKYHKKLMNPMLIRFELFFWGIQMKKKKPETQYIQIAFTQLTIGDKVNIIYGSIMHECGKTL